MRRVHGGPDGPDGLVVGGFVLLVDGLGVVVGDEVPDAVGDALGDEVGDVGATSLQSRAKPLSRSVLTQL